MPVRRIMKNILSQPEGLHFVSLQTSSQAFCTPGLCSMLDVSGVRYQTHLSRHMTPGNVSLHGD